MKSNDLILFKNDITCLNLDEIIIQDILDSFNQSNIKTNKIVKKQVNILKNNKIQVKKDLIENKLINIMNKVSFNNINELIKEYLNTINIITNEEYIIIQQEILSKIIKDIKFINNMIPFIIKLFSIEKYRLNIIPSHFMISIYNILLSNYNNVNDDETYRISCLTLIKKLIEFNFFTKDMYLYISNLLLDNKNYKVDIYYWFNDSMININTYHDKLMENIIYCRENDMKREELMIESLLVNTLLVNTIPINTLPINTLPINTLLVNNNIQLSGNTCEVKEDSRIIIINNIIEEYLYLGIVNEVEQFINSELKSIDCKNIFCKELLNTYLTLDLEKRKSVLKLYEELIKNKVIVKSNISKGLLLYLDTNRGVNNIIEGFLKFLKNNNITKNIEHIFKKYKIKIDNY